MEILAPAGEWEALTAAVNAGADAVYLGGKMFNARQSAANFDQQLLERATDYLHARARRIYVTFNTLIAGDEMEDALKYAAFLREIGVDAVILQDLGLLKLIRETLPDLPVHASTQMTVHSPEGVKFLEEFGVRRVVLARELALADIRSIAERCRAELEVFVHGALCISYSGACLFSSMVGGRSGNRGRCAQPCRLEYELLRNGEPIATKQGSHLLSPKDLCLLGELPSLAEAGVASLKIEGRMKTPNYVGTVVRVYREALDRMERDPQKYRAENQDMQRLTAVFNRGLTTGYLKQGLDREGMSPGRPSNRGQYLGRVLSYDFKTQRATVEVQTDLEAGDGIEFWVTRGGRCGQRAEDLRIGERKISLAKAGEKLTLPVAKPVYPGDRIFRTASVQIERLVESDQAGRIPCTAMVRAAEGESLEVSLTDEEGRFGKALSPQPLERANKHPITSEVLRAQMERLGDTPFILKDLQWEIMGEPMAPLSLINAVRREAAAQLVEKRVKPMKRPAVNGETIRRVLNKYQLAIEPLPNHPRLAAFVGTQKAVQAAIDGGADRVYFGGEAFSIETRWTPEELTASIRSCREQNVEPVVALPRILRHHEVEVLRSSCQMAEEHGAAGILVSHPGQAWGLRAISKLPLFANTGFNLFNPASIALLMEYGFSGAALSPELTLGQVDEIYRSIGKGFDLELVVHGALELMTLEFCPVNAWAGDNSRKECAHLCHKGNYALRDRKGYMFPLENDQFCRTHLFNAVDLVLAGELNRFKRKGWVLRLELRDRGSKEVEETLALYRHALDNPTEKEDLLEEAKRISGRGMTRGHYFRGVE